jgi:hypothetical protein
MRHHGLARGNAWLAPALLIVSVPSGALTMDCVTVVKTVPPPDPTLYSQGI